MTFWPGGISIEDTISPLKLLDQAREDWETKSNGLLTLVLQESSGDKEGIVVHAKNVISKRTATLFTVNFPEGWNEYPAFILTPFAINEACSESYREFRDKLFREFQASRVKSIVSNLLIDTTNYCLEKGEQ